jgi:general secretion pathway protein F
VNFSVRHFDPVTRAAGQSQIEAASQDAAAAMIAARGWTVLDIAPSRSLSFNRTHRLDLRLFCRELRGLLNAGMTIVEALDTLSARAGKHPNTVAYQAVQSRVREGRALSKALEESGLPIPLLLVAGIRASERSGRIAQALTEYLQYEELLRESRRRVINAALYPLLVVGFGLLVTLFLLGYVVPRFTRIYDDFAGNLSPLTHVIMAMGRVVGSYLWWVLAGIAATAMSVLYFGQTRALRDWLLRQLMRVGWIARLAESFQLARIHRTLALLLRGGFPLPEALQMVHSLAAEPRLAQRIASARLSISEGQAIGRTFAAQRLVDEVGERLIAVGERSGSLDQSLDVIAQELQLNVDTQVERMTRLLEPILIFTVAVMIGAIVVMMYLPIFDLAGGIS